MIIFDLDGTLAPSKFRIGDSMAELLKKLLLKYKVAIITGGDFPQFEKQIFPFLGSEENILSNLYICPTCSTKMYIFKENIWQKLYSENLTNEEKNKIFEAFNFVMEKTGFKPEKIWGEIIEDRETQITFSALGQDAPLIEKEKWDPDFKKRLIMKEHLDKILNGFFVRIGGKTSIDITKSGIDKAYGIRKLKDVTNIDFNDMLFVGDAIFPGGNDYPAKEMGLDCICTTGPEQTEEIIEKLIKE